MFSFLGQRTLIPKNPPCAFLLKFNLHPLSRISRSLVVNRLYSGRRSFCFIGGCEGKIVEEKVPNPGATRCETFRIFEEPARGIMKCIDGLPG